LMVHSAAPNYLRGIVDLFLLSPSLTIQVSSNIT
jgi:hypothetical protein